MPSGTLEYRVEDRSILLPFYKRALIEPLLPYIPARVSPNAITHAGHAANLAAVALLLGTGAARGWPFVAAAALMHLQVWCDNADGGHARRTDQCSPLGEFLDHGLDVLNVIYIGILTCVALGVTPGWWVALTLVVPTAVSVTYWEQAVTGTFRLGLLNQIESAVVLTGVLFASAWFGNDFSARLTYGGVTARLAFCVWAFAQVAVGIVRSVWRVARVEPGALSAIAPLLAFDIAVAAAASTGALTTAAAVVVGVAMNTFVGVRTLVRRLHGERPQVEPLLVGGAALLATVAGVVRAGVTLPTATSWSIAVVACGVFGLRAALDARRGVRRVQGMVAVIATEGH
jgi:phosphatidylglycerophosphate synthase